MSHTQQSWRSVRVTMKIGTENKATAEDPLHEQLGLLLSTGKEVVIWIILPMLKISAKTKVRSSSLNLVSHQIHH